MAVARRGSLAALMLAAGSTASCSDPAAAPPSAPEARGLEAERLVERLSSWPGARLLLPPEGEARAEGGSFRWSPGRRGPGVEVRLPERADQAFRVEERGSGVSVQARLEGAIGARGERASGHVAYPGAIERGGVVFRVLADGTEDHLLLDRPAGERAAYVIAPGERVAGLRLFDGTLELLDARGVPRLRVERPYLIDAHGRRHQPAVEIEGCAADRDPAPPWRRAVIPWGTGTCRLVISWQGLGVTYPAALDPAWRSAASMNQPRVDLTAARLSGGEVLVAGGGTLGNYAELYAPPPPTSYGTDLGAWSKTGAPPLDGAREQASLVALDGDRALLVGGRRKLGGGNYQPLSSSAVFDLAKGTWATGPSLHDGRFYARATRLTDGRVLVTGGKALDLQGDLVETETTEILSVSPPSTAHGPPMADSRAEHGLWRLGDGRVLVAGGSSASGGLRASAEVLDASATGWTTAGPMAHKRRRFVAAVADDGRALALGGGGNLDAFPLSSVEGFDPLKGAWAELAPLAATRTEHAGAKLSDGRVLINGGQNGFVTLPNAELYDPAADGGKGLATLITDGVVGRTGHRVIALDGLKGVAIGGGSFGEPQASVDLFDQFPLGSPCADGHECRSGQCVDGVCCDGACEGECEACAQAVRGGADPDGTCALIEAGLSARPGGACVDDTDKDPCGLSGRCNGTAKSGVEACLAADAGTLCGPTPCGPPSFSFEACDGKGTCVPVFGCGLYASCSGPGACAASCSSHAECAKGAYCGDDGACHELLPLGSKCSPLLAGVDCGGGRCVDGVCCDEPCDGACEACSAEEKQSGPDGACGPSKAGSTPKTPVCAKTPPESCGTSGACDGKGACAKYGAATPCGKGLCTEAGGEAQLSTFHCEAGACVPGAGVSCGAYRCSEDGAGCRSSCGSDADCGESAYCKAGACQARGAPGGACAEGRECASLVCADGVCCGTSCDGQCEACDLPGLEGSCVAVVGEPRKGRPACAPGDPEAPCSARRCDGSTRTSCQGFAGEDVACGEPSCLLDQSAALAPSRCAGNGYCREATPTPCAPYLCRQGACLSACSADADCASGSRCKDGKCVGTTSCSDATHLRLVDGTQKPCSPYRCDQEAAACREACASSADCAPGSVCAGEGRCERPKAPDDPGADACGCRAPGRAPPPPPALASLAVLAIAWSASRLARRLRRSTSAAARASAVALGLGASGCAGRDEPPPSGPSPEAEACLRSIEEALSQGRAGQPPGQPAPLPPSEARGYVPDGSTLRPALDRPAQALASLPSRASGRARLREARSGLSVGFSAVGAADAPALSARGYLVYPRALGGAHLVVRSTGAGVEDYLWAPGPERPERLTYALDLSPEVAGLRLVAGSLELLDQGGAPRLRVAPPYVLTPRGRRPAALSLLGCQADTDPRPPWGRPVVPPGSTSCTLEVSWAPVDPPFLVDPGWQATADMAVARIFHSATLLPGGRPVVVGGAQTPDMGGPLTSCEVFDPKTSTWASVGSLNAPRGGGELFTLPDGRLLFAAGISDTSANSKASELYDPSTGTWSVSGSIEGRRYTQAGTLLADGRPLIVGGYRPSPDTFYADAQVYDVSTGQWSTLPAAMARGRRYHRAFTLPDGRVLVATGKRASASNQEELTTTTEILDLTNMTFSAGPPLAKARQYVAAGSLPQGVLVAGGLASGLPPIESSTELYRYDTNAWEPGPSMTEPRAYGAFVFQAETGKAYVTGGLNIFTSVASTEVIDTATLGAFLAGPTMIHDRAAHAAIAFPGGQVLVAGGGSGTAGMVSGIYASAERFGLGLPGEKCTSSGQCASAHCVDGVCCESACDGLCEACSAYKKDQGESGVCGPVALGVDIDDECDKQPVATCGQNGACDGKGACAMYAEGTACVGSCTLGEATAGSCTAGVCKAEKALCSPYACDEAGSACASYCTKPEHCDASAFCEPETKACKPRLALGAACASPGETQAQGDARCQSGHCVDGVCCESACQKGCSACKASLQEPGPEVLDGRCLPARAGDLDPRGSCVDEGSSCQSKASCDGQGSCESYQKGETCAPPSCQGSAGVGFRLARFACGEASCLELPQADSCGNYLCEAGGCRTSCDDEGGCIDRAHCVKGACVPRAELGASCASASECLSGFCADGVCCNSACKGQCAACDLPDQKGLCAPVKEAPRNGRPACGGAAPGPGPADPCQARRCDGLDADKCAGFAGSDVICREGGCSSGRQSYPARCDGKGGCGELISRSCFPFVCASAECKTSCSADADCADGTRCVGGQCAPLASCGDDGVLRALDGSVLKECGLYRCNAKEGTCRTRCDSTADCVAGNVCDGRGACTPALDPVAADSGCACALPGPRPSPTPRLALPLALALVAPLARRAARRR